HAADLRGQRDRHGAKRRSGEGDHGAHDRLRRGGGHRGLGARGGGGGGGRFGQVQLRAARDRQERPARAHRGEDRGLGRARDGQRRELPHSRAAGRQAGGGAGRLAGGGRRGLRAQRLAGRADRQDRRAAAVRGDRHLGGDPAP